MKSKILLIDDEKEITDALTLFLKYEGYDVDAVNDPLKAMSLIEETNYMVIISDISMPEKNGIQLLKEIKDYNGMIQVIMVTAYVTMDNILSCHRLGASDCLFKPISLDKLKKAVEEAVNKTNKWEKILKGLQAGKKQAE